MPYFQMPVKGRLTDAFGWREAIPGVVGAQLHSGRDIAADAGTPIYAAAPGTVSRVWWDAFADGTGAGGWMIEIDHGGGVRTRYAHKQARSWRKPGERVILESVIGHVGDSGAATGPHLHFEVLINGEFVNPDLYLHPRVGSKPTPTPKPKPKPVIEEDPMPISHDVPEYNPAQTCPPGKWTTLSINKKGDVTVVFAGAKRRSGDLHAAVNATGGEFEARYVYDTISADGKKVTKTVGSVIVPSENGRAVWSWPFSLPAKKAGAEQRIRIQVRPRGKTPVKVSAVVTRARYWEK